MPSRNAELVFVSGPQQGQREALVSSSVLIGRDPSADICIQEEAVSRLHARMDRVQAGWVFTNLSRNGTFINSKRYKKSRKQILLDTGDVLQIGQETFMLFVGVGDDSEQALQEYRRAEPIPAGAAREEAPAAPGHREDSQQAQSPAAEPGPAMRSLPEESEEDVAASGDDSGSKRFKKFAIGIGIYFAAMLGLFLFLASRDSSEAGGAGQAPPRIPADQIERILIDKTYQRQADPVRAAQMLREAEQFFRRRNDEPGNLYRAVKAYKLHMAYRQVANFQQYIHQAHYNQALEQLKNRVLELYDEAYVKTRRGRWAEAQQAWEMLQAELPVKQGNEPELQNKLWEHIKRQVTYVLKQRKQNEGKPGRDRPGL
jgi:hypothetical protein